MSEQIGAVLIFAGLFLAVSGMLVLLGRGLRVLFKRTDRRRLLGPLVVMVAGLLVGAAPLVYQRVYIAIVGLGERERVVDGRKALVLTGWDRPDYTILASKGDVEILEMGNPDVTDETLEALSAMHNLRELTLNDTQITDAGLMTLQRFQNLESLRIARTAVTPDGVQALLADPPPHLREIDVTGNGIPTSILRKWKNAATPAEGSLPHPTEDRRYVN
ncbi:MAG: hypothetical protein DWH79_05910 [Planctomycetota bacterium]|nr:MAG: hypothetical protein DWH79_05910 [Planctomycetota bacterium]